MAKELNSSYDAEFSQELLDSILLDHHLGDKDSPGNTQYYQSFVGRKTSARDLPVITIYSQPPKKNPGGGVILQYFPVYMKEEKEDLKKEDNTDHA